MRTEPLKTDNFRIELPTAVREIIEELARAGFEAYAVGGCVRDSLLEREPEDWDITTSASPQEVKALFPRTVDTGIEHGTVTVLRRQKGYEVTTYRLDGAYEDHRHPSSVTFTQELAEDLRRRDFTINAMAYSEQNGLIDLFGGREDLKNGVIRSVGKPMERFSEDALRIFRAVRFSAQLDFIVEPETLAAMKALAGDLRRVSAERIRVELTKLLLSEHPDRLLLLQETGISAVMLPEWDRMLATGQNNPYHCWNVGLHTLKAIEAMQTLPAYQAEEKKGRQILAYSVLLHDCGKPDCRTEDENGVAHFHGHQKKSAELAKQILQRLKFDNDTIAAVTKLVRFHDSRHTVEPEKNDAGLRRLTNRVGSEWMPFLFAVQRADIYGHKPELIPQMLCEVDRMEEGFRGIVARQECVSLKQLAVTGRDLLAVGYSSGPALGQTLRALLAEVLNEPEKNERETLLALAKQYLREDRIPENPLE